MSNYIIHDLPQELEQELIHIRPDAVVISAQKPYARCIGCFGCWLKTPGKCVFQDGMEYLGAKVLTAEEITIISRNLYGGYSVEIKRLWDRCIGGVLPFFIKKNGELHHSARYKNTPKLKVCFYDTQAILPEEKILSEKLVAANALNFMVCEYEVQFFDHVQMLLEVLV